jgi:uncharacterized membrane protein
MGESNRAMYAATILRPREEVYDFWRNWQNLPFFSRHLKSVEDLGEGRTRWTAIGPNGDVVWDAETVEDVPGETISWRSVGEADVPNQGSVIFRDAPQDRGTEVLVQLTYDIPWGAVGKAFAKLTGTSPEAEIAESLRRFKAIMEIGELPVIEGQPSNIKRGENVPGDQSPLAGVR